MTALCKWISAAVALLTAMARRRRQRQSLANLNDHLLRDIGVSRSEAAREARKLF
jgi:uncharacterized protein YjiS (DUF1127 family)